MNSSPRTQAVAEGALLAVLTALLALTGIYIPLLNIVTNLVWTIPIILVTVRHGLPTGFMSLTVAGLLIFLLSSPVTAVFMVIMFGGIALVYGYAFHKKIKPGMTLLAGAVTVIISFLAASVFSFLVTGINPLDIATLMKESLDATIALYRDLGFFDRYGAEGVTEESTRQTMQAYMQTIALFVPAIVVMYGLMTALINYIISQRILLRLKADVPRPTPLIYWRLPWWTVWGFIAGFGANLAGSYLQNQLLVMIGSNIVMVYSPVLCILGFSVACFFLNKYFKGQQVYRFFLILFIIFFFRIAVYVLAVMGLADLLFNYRRLSDRGQGQG